MNRSALGMLGFVALTGVALAAPAWDSFPDGFTPLNGQPLLIHLCETTQGSTWDTCVAVDGSASVVLRGMMCIEMPRPPLTFNQLKQFMADAERLKFFDLPTHPSGGKAPAYGVSLSVVDGDKHQSVSGYGPDNAVVAQLREELVHEIPPPPVPTRSEGI